MSNVVRRQRNSFTAIQKAELKRRFLNGQYLSTPEKAQLANQIGLTEKQIKIWYQNNRAKQKRASRAQRIAAPMNQGIPANFPLFQIAPAA